MTRLYFAAAVLVGAIGIALPVASHAQTGRIDAAAAEDQSIRPFRAHVPDAAIAEMRRRIRATRWPDKETVDDASQGVQLARLKPVVEHWGSGYDWRKAEAKLNAFPQFMTRIDGVDIHFIHVRSKHPGALPVIITHGWPGSVFELIKTIGPLTDPTAYGGRAEDAFDVVIPSLPGFGFSGRPTSTGWSPERIAKAWTELMKRLGYTRYVAQGGDWGAGVSLEMARQAPKGLMGIDLNLVPAVPPEVGAALAAGGPAPAGLSDAEREMFDTLLASARMGNSAYFTMLTARPQSVGYGATDSPTGLAAWLLVHAGFNKWSFGDDPAQSLTRDEVLDDISLYWLTNTAASAGRLYWENRGRSVLLVSPWNTKEIKLPLAVTVFGEDAYRPPESWVRRAYPNVIYYHQVEKGGHFAAWEQPQLFAEELRAGFRSLR
jgi:pimeloyl-ACP methyl ester carboxylesterase